MEHEAQQTSKHLAATLKDVGLSPVSSEGDGLPSDLRRRKLPNWDLESLLLCV